MDEKDKFVLLAASFIFTQLQWQGGINMLINIFREVGQIGKGYTINCNICEKLLTQVFITDT